MMIKKFVKEVMKDAIREAVAAATNTAAKPQPTLPGDAPSDKQVHVFDFDDTLAITDNSTGVMLYNDGKPAHNNPKDVSAVKEWLKSVGVSEEELLKGPGGKPIEWIDKRQGWMSYVSSNALSPIQSKFMGKEQQAIPGVPGHSEPSAQGYSILLDFTPSAYVNTKTTKPIKQTIEKMKALNAKGAKTAVMTARKGEGKGENAEGQPVSATNKVDIMAFLRDQGAQPNQGVMGVTGQNKGDAIAKTFVGQGTNATPPEEVHFYDDMPKNTKEVSDALVAKDKIPSEVFIYGPGTFAKIPPSANNPTAKYPRPAKQQ